MTPRVWSKRKSAPPYPQDAVYVGRGTRWGNPFVIGKGRIETRTQAIDAFRVYAENRLIDEPRWLRPLRGKDLVCWCAPKPCHADVLMELANGPDRIS